ncbi:hypothetical protein MHYP_G00151040 [Metynnis hypsauchen]
MQSQDCSNKKVTDLKTDATGFYSEGLTVLLQEAAAESWRVWSVAMETDSSLLSTELEQQSQEELYQQLLLQTIGKIQSDGTPSKVIRPQPGVCVKTSSLTDQQKVFVNICQSRDVPPPPHLSQEALVELLESDDPTGYKVPMSLGEAHTEIDNSSKSCTVYDVVINEEFFQNCQKDTLFQQFLIAVSLEGLENKYSLELSRDVKILKNRKFMGSLTEQNIRTKSKPVIQEINSKELQLQNSTVKSPQFGLWVEPPFGEAEFLIAEIQLPGVSSAHSLLLDLGEDRLVLNARPSLFHLDIFFPFLVDQENSAAQYNTNTQVLTVTMPVLSS